MKAPYKLPIALAAVVILGAGWWLWSRYAAIGAAALEKTKAASALYVQERARSLIKPEDFSDSDTARQRKVFETFFEAVQSPNLVRMKVWDRNFTVIWSNLSDLIGQRFPDNHEVEEALEGKIEFEIEKLKTEHLTERQFQELGELYVPISGGRGDIAGVLEVYQPTHALRQEVKAEFLRSAALAAVVSAALYVVALLALRALKKKPA
jgi:hypothetical protein